MPRVREVTLDGLTLRISPLSYDEAEEYIKEGVEMIRRDPKPTQEEWAKRTLNSVVLALNKAAGKEEWTLNGEEGKKKLTKELDIGMINRLYEEFVELSSLSVVKQKGEALATSTSPKSDVA
jgi:hypothetical protein